MKIDKNPHDLLRVAKHLPTYSIVSSESLLCPKRGPVYRIVYRAKDNIKQYIMPTGLFGVRPSVTHLISKFKADMEHAKD